MMADISRALRSGFHGHQGELASSSVSITVISQPSGEQRVYASAPHDVALSADSPTLPGLASSFSEQQ
ncbi:hypothetical protein EEJ42_18620 [Streptomyces botrytidirepellens]|uniref:Uncharacterized protein n=1 Tax=Streptomyces botrytidirepellens TaxID=2486417 RepID=A0A3M8W4M0_9ACTN|nr:hypothetical protein EEJ42_18620 [Streptomyces botrytidirepellens]